ncbi:M56 family metallopeptidase [Streptomyces sp. H10-C2]|uniref:M56 family metallopeptidase n=1 Tax=unclassified Streptomyces TaxID=2593676 RepID=UPI0024BA072F|nr:MULTISPECIES: M56 family metallopeptidase [unclassified Streptomyces]MDJ0346502.1 M56 family metallopeptidase [Streptomyces sp. PH10-H1]MDJ0374964.1 M56 family metallopeptidase [Streptomyces sp. H10-C2]
MRIGVYLPFAVAAMLAVLAPALARRLTPRAGTVALTGSALVASMSWLGALALLAFSGFGQIPLVAFLGSWSTRVLAAQDPVTRTVAAICAIVLVVATIGLGVASWRRGRVLVAAFQECHRLPGDGELAVIDDTRLEAFALPGLPGMPGRVVVSTGMLRTLEGAEREALMAHERAHLRGHHHFFLLVLQLAAAACPLLRPLATEGAFTIERWADEDAARAVGDRAVVARALARAALAKKGSRPRAGALAATGGPVPRRVRALLAPAPVPRTAPLLVFALLLAVCCGGLAEAAHETELMFEGAQHAYTAST